MTDTPIPKIADLQRVFAQLENISERKPVPPPTQHLSIEERMDRLEAEQVRLGEEVVAVIPAMIEGISLMLASVFADAQTPERLFEHAQALTKMPDHGETEWHRTLNGIGRLMAAQCLLRMSTMLGDAADLAAVMSDGGEGVH